MSSNSSSRHKQCLYALFLALSSFFGYSNWHPNSGRLLKKTAISGTIWQKTASLLWSPPRLKIFPYAEEFCYLLSLVIQTETTLLWICPIFECFSVVIDVGVIRPHLHLQSSRLRMFLKWATQTHGECVSLSCTCFFLSVWCVHWWGS